MDCRRCGQEISDDAAFCQRCGADQRQRTSSGRRLRRSQVDRQIAGVCGGVARYLDTDPVFVRIGWVVLTILPGVLFLGILAYVVAWLIVPEAQPGTETVDAEVTGFRRRHLQRSSDARIGGVCGGIAEYFDADPTAIRLLWVLLSIFPGAVICGVIAYVVAWFIMPAAPVPASPPPAPAPATPTE